MALQAVGDTGGLPPNTGAPNDRNPGGLSSRGTRAPAVELHEVYQPMLYPTMLNNPVLTLPANFGGQDGLSAYPIHYKYARYNAGVGRHWDTRDFVNHNLDARSNDYMPRAVPDPSCYSYFQQPRGGQRPMNPAGTTNVYNPPYELHGLPPLQSSEYYFLQEM